MKIHPLTVCREKLQNNDFITTNYRKKAEMLEDIIAEEEELRNFAAEIYFEISNKILVRNSKRRKVLDCLKKLNLEYNYTSYVTDFDEINTMLEQFENRCQQLLGKKNDFSDAIENDYLNSRNILRNSIMDDTDIYNSISTVNPRIYEKMKWYLEGELRNNTETRKLELVLARIVSHAFTKTSPMGWLNKVGIIGTMNPIRYELKKNNISLNFVLLFQMYDRIILRDEYIEDVKFKLNKNFYIVDSEINIFGQRDNAQNHKLFKSRDCNVKVKNNPYFAPILNQADKNDWYFKDILELLELDKEQTGVFIRKLVEIGLFRIDSYFSDEGDVLQHFVDKLGEITKEKDDLASCVRGDFVEIQKLVKEINQEYSLDLEKRIIEIEKSACEKCGLDAGFKSREFIYKDNIVVKDKVHNLPESAQYSISKLMQLYTIFDVNTRIQQEVKMELERKMKTDSIPINNPYIFQLVANVNMKYSNFWIDPWKQITSESEIIKKLDELRTSFINELLKSAEKNEVVISEEFIDSLINQIPSELKKKKAAYSIFYEMDCDDVVINKIYPGYMSFYNRFLRYTDIIEKYRDEIKDFYKVEGENIAEIYETFGFNANSYYPIFDDRLEFDLTRNHAIDENYKEVINIYDTNLVYHDNEFLLQKDGTDYKPVICTSLMRVLYPGIITFYITDFFVKKQENLWDNENVNKVKFSDTYTGNKSGSLVDKFIDKVLESKVPIVEKFSNIRTSVKVKELLMRTSSQSAQGYSFFPYECPDDVLDEIIDSVKLSLADVTDDLICVQLVMNTDSVRVYEIKRDHVNTKELNDIDMNSLPHDSLDYVDLKNVSVGVIMYTNCKLYEMNEIWYQYTYIKMGEIAQRISNICGTKELSARPMKNMNDLYMKNRLMESDSYDPGYFIVIGKSMNDSLKMLMR